MLMVRATWHIGQSDGSVSSSAVVCLVHAGSCLDRNLETVRVQIRDAVWAVEVDWGFFFF
jgi:hypothetical protein